MFVPNYHIEIHPKSKMFHSTLRSSIRRLRPALASHKTCRPTIVAKNQFPVYSFSTVTTRPFQILGVQQIALGSTDKDGMTALWQDIFGLKPHATKRIEKENVEEDILKLGAAKSPFVVEIDLMQPIDPDKSPKVRVLQLFG